MMLRISKSRMYLIGWWDTNNSFKKEHSPCAPFFDVVFSDNYFDLPAQTKVTITVPMPADIKSIISQMTLKKRRQVHSMK